MSTPQAVPTVQVWDYVSVPGNSTGAYAPGLSGLEIEATLNYNQALYVSPVVGFAPIKLTTQTDENGYWTMYFPANDLMTPTGTTYVVRTPYKSYQIQVASAGVPVGGWQSSALVPTPPTDLGPFGAQFPSITVNGNALFEGPDPWLDVKHPFFGAIGDDGVDDYAAFQLASDTVSTTAGAIIWVPASLYYIGTGIVSTNISSLVVLGTGRHWHLSGTGNAGGSVLRGHATSMTIWKCEWTAGRPLHQGPIFDRIGFEDAFVSLNTVTATGVSYNAPNTTITVPSTTGIVDSAIVNLLGFTNAGITLNAPFTVISHTATSVVVNIGGDPGAVSVMGSVTPDTMSPATSMILLHIKNQTRWEVRDAAFFGGLVGLKVESTTDASWGLVDNPQIGWCDKGIWFTGGAAISTEVRGGNYTLASNQIGIDWDSGFSLKISAGKWDIGQNSYTSGAGAIGVRVQTCFGLQMVNQYFEMKGTATTRAISMGSGGLVYGSVVGAQVQGNHTPITAAVETFIYCNGTNNSTNAVSVSITNCGGYGMDTMIDIGPNCRGVTVTGGVNAHGKTAGVLVESGAVDTVIVGFQQATGSSFGGGYTHISDSGTNTRRFGNNGFSVLENTLLYFALSALTYSASIATNAANGNVFTIVATNGTAFTIANPTNLRNGQELTYDIKNSSGGAMGVVTWGSAGLFLLAGAFTNPANTKRRTIRFYYDGTNLIEMTRAGADI